jgi:tetratricopeptide (TPR) repeat protein
MDPREIRELRGSLSRAAFARLIGVTQQTVLRWELSEENKEARRPRAKMIEVLRRIQVEGAILQSASPQRDEDELDEDEGASEPEPDSASDRSSEDERTVQPLLDALCGREWARAEDALLSLLSSPAIRTPEGRVLATLGLVQAQLLGRLDQRGALTTLQPVLDEAKRGRLPRRTAARAHALAALLFAAPDSRFFDVGRVNVHAARAEELLDESQNELAVISAVARIFATRFLEPQVSLRTYRAQLGTLERGSSPLASYLVSRIHAALADLQGGSDAARRHADEMNSLGESMGLFALTIWAISEHVSRLLRGPVLPDAVLSLTRAARDAQRAGRLPPSESFLRILAAEIDALNRLARLAEATAVANEAMTLAGHAGLARHALAMPIARLYSFTNRVGELATLASALEADSRSTYTDAPLSQHHVVLVRAFHAGLNEEYDRAAALAEQVCQAPSNDAGHKHLIHEAHFELAQAKVALRDFTGADAALARAEEVLQGRPSVWNSAMILWLRALTLFHQGRYAEGRQKMLATVPIFDLVGDVIRGDLVRGVLADTALGPFTEERERALQGLHRYRDLSPELARRVGRQSTVRTSHHQPVESLPERLLVAAERLSIAKLTTAQLPGELSSILETLFPNRAVLLGSDADRSQTVEISLAGVPSRIGLAGALTHEERAVLRLLTLMVPLASRPNLTATEPSALAEGVLPHFIAVSSVTRRLKAEIARLSHSSSTLLITGESGTGKEVVARAVHDLSTRAERPYVVFNCASVPRELFESQLFGHRRGSFTGATSDALGVIRAADGGTLFLDEIGELPLDMQPKLLRFLENGEVLPIGEQQARRVDARILAATHRDLGRLVREGQFREDLYYRLNVIPLQVPPLRERKEDVLALARLFVNRLTPADMVPPDLGQDALTALREHTWPGNVRELRNVIERAMAYAPVPAVLGASQLGIATR